MLRNTSRLLALVLLCGVGSVSMRADEPVKTGKKRDTLLYVRTDPAGATVFLNGKELGTTDGLFPVEPGRGTIFLELDGHDASQRQVIIRANGITRVELKLAPQAKADSAQRAAIQQPQLRSSGDQSSISFVARLPQDGAIELVGVTDGYRPTLQSRWWRPDGSVATIGPFAALQKYSFLADPGDDKVFTFLVRFENLPADASTDPAGGINTSTTPQGPSRGSRNWVPGRGTTEENPAQFPIGAPLWEETAVYDVLDANGAITLNNARRSRPTAGADTYTQSNIHPYYYKMFPMVLAGAAPTTDLRVGVSMGAWETVISWKPDRAGTSSFRRDGQVWKVAFSKATIAEDTTQVKLTSAYTYGQWNKRLVAVAADGSERMASIGRNSGGDNGAAVFHDVPLSSIKEFRLQVRPYHWVEFDNISLRPGQNTYVKVVSSAGLPAPSSAHGSAPQKVKKPREQNRPQPKK